MEIPTDFGETLSWKYLCYVREHPISWRVPTRILYGEHDNLTSLETISAFAEKTGAALTVMPGGEHWFHTDEQVRFLDDWITESRKYREWSIPGKKYAVYWLFAFKRSTFSNVLFFPNLKCHEDLALIPLLVAASNIVVTLSYIGYNYTCNNPGSITNTKSKEAERSRAKDFVKAYKYATQNFARLFTVSPLDYEFFVSDFDRRLLDKYNSLSEELKEELAELFGIE